MWTLTLKEYFNAEKSNMGSVTPRAVFLKVGSGDPQGSLKGFQRVPNNFHYNFIHKEHNDRLYDYFAHGFHSLSVIKHIKAKNPIR